MKNILLPLITILLFTVLMMGAVIQSGNMFVERMNEDTADLIQTLNIAEEQSTEATASLNLLKQNIVSYVSSVATWIIFGLAFLLVLFVFLTQTRN